jgi:hypothetical protein
MRSMLVTSTLVLALGAVGLIVYPVSMVGQQPMGNGMSHDQMQMMHQHMVPGSQTSDATSPTMPGQDAFGAIQEIVRILESDPNTDWSKVNLEALRQHLIDMNEVTLKAKAVVKPIEGGIEATVIGESRTVESIKRMVPAHAQEIERSHLNGWSAKTEPLPDGVVLTITSSDPQEVQHIRGLDFIGVMVSGSHHQPHHLGMAKGDFVHLQ